MKRQRQKQTERDEQVSSGGFTQIHSCRFRADEEDAVIDLSFVLKHMTLVETFHHRGALTCMFIFFFSTDRDRQVDVPVVEGGVGEEGHVGGELAPEPEDKERKSSKRHLPG